MAEEMIPATSSLAPASSSLDTDQSHAEHKSKREGSAMEEHIAESTGDGAGHKAGAEGTDTNGDGAHDLNGATDKAAMPETEDTEMEHTDAAVTIAASSSTPAKPSNGTPASSKKSGSASTKKRSSAVPEHKTKKLNKRKSKSALVTQLDAQPGDYYFARMKGHPPWPSIVCDEEMLPQSLLDSRPITTKQPDGTFKKEDYADGGKRAQERTFPIMFLHTNEFAWIPNTELTPLDTETTKDPTEKGKSKLLLAAYEKASEHQSLQHYKEMLADHQKALQEDQEAQAERETKKSTKSKRKSMDAGAQSGDVDEMDLGEEASAEKPKSKKRKKEIGSDGEEKPAKTPKTGRMLKVNPPKTPTSEPPTKKKAAKPKGSSSKKAAAKVTASDDEDVVDTPKVEEKPLSPAAAKEMKEKKVLYYRHKLQRGFLSRDTMPKEDEMKSMSDFLGELETFRDIEASIIRATKIHKVLKAMMKLPSIPLDEEFEFKKRSHKLLDKWTEILSNDQTAGGAGDKDDDSKPEVAAATTNGDVKKDVKEVAKEAEAGEAIAPEEEKEEDLENKIGTTVEGEEEAGKPAETKETAEEAKTDGPAVDSAPAEEYRPPGETVEATT